MNKNLPEFQHTFFVDIEGTQTKQRFAGEFTYNHPNLRTISEISKYKARLDGGLTNIDSDTAFIHSMISQLRFTLSDYPKWWEQSDFGLNLYDLNVIVDIYNKTMEFEAKIFENISEVANKKEDKKEKEDEKESKGKNKEE